MANPILLLGLGAAAMYFLDPQNGRRRRTDFQNQLHSAQRQLGHGRDVVVRDATNRAHGLLLETRHALEARRTGQMGENVPTLGGIARECVSPWMRTRWSPAQRAIAGALGSAVTMIGYFRGGLRGMALCALGGSLVARATANEDIKTLMKGRAFQVEKTIDVNAPAAQVFAYWRNLEGFPIWMAHVQEVRYLGGDRYHWVVDGPMGKPVEWDSELLNVVENHEMTWRSVAGSEVEHTGRVRFEDMGESTRVHVQMRYAPPGGLVGHVVAKAFGVDPENQMGEDLARMKTAIETGKAPHDSAAQRRLGSNGTGMGEGTNPGL
jgi:uncharacterized membrane protein